MCSCMEYGKLLIQSSNFLSLTFYLSWEYQMYVNVTFTSVLFVSVDITFITTE